MKDMIVNLTGLQSIDTEVAKMSDLGIIIRRPLAPEMDLITDWVKNNFSLGWSNEVQVAFSGTPVACFIAHTNKEIAGFACYDVTARSFFGPTGVHPNFRGQNIGKVLLIKSLEALREKGYAYGIIGGVGPEAYYEKTVGAHLIPGSEKNIYSNMLPRK